MGRRGFFRARGDLPIAQPDGGQHGLEPRGGQERWNAIVMDIHDLELRLRNMYTGASMQLKPLQHSAGRALSRRCLMSVQSSTKQTLFVCSGIKVPSYHHTMASERCHLPPLQQACTPFVHASIGGNSK